MKRLIRIVFWILAFAAVSGMVALAVLFAATRPSLQVLWQNCQPETMTYDDGGYCISVIEREMDLSGWPLYVDNHYALVVTRGSQTDYGHMVDYSFTNNDSDISAYINQSQSEWSPEGVTFVEQDGHRLFIPASVFIGGR